MKCAVPGDPGVEFDTAALRALEIVPRAPIPSVVAAGEGVLALEWIGAPTLHVERRRAGRGFEFDAVIGRALAKVQLDGRATALMQRPARGELAGRFLWTTPELFSSLSPQAVTLFSRVHAHARALQSLHWLIEGERVAPKAVVHGDLRQPNVLVSKRRVTFVDWEASGAGDPLRDVGSLLADDYRGWLRPESEAEQQSEEERTRHHSALLFAWEAEAVRRGYVLPVHHRARIVGWLADALLRHAYSLAHHRFEYDEPVVSAALELLDDPITWARSLFPEGT